jgi:MOSC domain-containing protein YiiM
MQSSATLLWLNVGQPADLALPRGTIKSAIVKTPVTATLELTERGLQGDRQADLTVHGGPDKAVCVYPVEHYPYWQNRLRIPLEPGAFGENFTTSGLVESEVCIGDIYSVANAVVQVTQPRQPCFRLGARHERRIAEVGGRDQALAGSTSVLGTGAVGVVRS